MITRRWKILMVGLGGAGQRQLRVLREVFGEDAVFSAYRVRGLSHVITPKYELDTSEDVEKKYNIRSFRNLDEALEDSPDVAFVCNPSSLHMDVALRAARAGCHLFLEKPLSDSWNGVEELIQIARQKSLTTLVAFQLRFHPCLQWIREQLVKNRIGRLQSADLHVNSYLPDLHPYENFQSQYIARRQLGGGVILTEIHELDYAYWFFGMPRRMFTVGGRLGAYDIDVEDTVSLLMDHDRGRDSLPVHIQMSMVQRPPGRGCRINGENGQIVWDAAVPEVRVYDVEKKTWTVESFAGFDRSRLFTDQIRHFFECIEKGRRTVVDVESGAQSLKIALAAKESLRTRQTVVMEAEALCKP